MAFLKPTQNLTINLDDNNVIILSENQYHIQIDDETGKTSYVISKEGIMYVKKALNIEDIDLDIKDVAGNITVTSIMNFRNKKYIAIGCTNKDNTKSNPIARAYMPEMAAKRAKATNVVQILYEIAKNNDLPLLYTEFDEFIVREKRKEKNDEISQKPKTKEEKEIQRLEEHKVMMKNGLRPISNLNDLELYAISQSDRPEHSKQTEIVKRYLFLSKRKISDKTIKQYNLLKEQKKK